MVGDGVDIFTQTSTDHTPCNIVGKHRRTVVVTDAGRIRIDTLLEKFPIDTAVRRGGIDGVEYVFEILPHDLPEATATPSVECGLYRLVPRCEHSVYVALSAGCRVVECAC